MVIVLYISSNTRAFSLRVRFSYPIGIDCTGLAFELLYTLFAGIKARLTVNEAVKLVIFGNALACLSINISVLFLVAASAILSFVLACLTIYRAFLANSSRGIGVVTFLTNAFIGVNKVAEIDFQAIYAVIRGWSVT